MPLNEATKANLRRKSAYVDKVQLREGIPMFSWLDLSLTELCNRSAGAPDACTFCPRIDAKFYPNQNLHMPLRLVDKIAQELTDLNYQGVVVLCGYGEPLLHPHVTQIVKQFKAFRVEIVTNGDFLSARKIEDLCYAGVDYFVVSLYDGPHQMEKFQKVFAEAECSTYLLRDRWHSEADQFGLKLTNRAGTVTIGPQDPVDVHRPCYYLAYQMQVDWNGDVLLCPQDWHKRVKFGNLAIDSLWEAWTSLRLRKRRLELLRGKRISFPCNNCNTDGTLHGHLHKEVWLKETKLGAA